MTPPPWPRRPAGLRLPGPGPLGWVGRVGIGADQAGPWRARRPPGTPRRSRRCRSIRPPRRRPAPRRPPRTPRRARASSSPADPSTRARAAGSSRPAAAWAEVTSSSGPAATPARARRDSSSSSVTAELLVANRTPKPARRSARAPARRRRSGCPRARPPRRGRSPRPRRAAGGHGASGAPRPSPGDSRGGCALGLSGCLRVHDPSLVPADRQATLGAWPPSRSPARAGPGHVEGRGARGRSTRTLRAPIAAVSDVPGRWPTPGPSSGGIRAPGTGIPGVDRRGPRRRGASARTSRWSTARARRLCVEFAGTEFSRWVVTADDAPAVAASIEQARR